MSRAHRISCATVASVSSASIDCRAARIRPADATERPRGGSVGREMADFTLYPPLPRKKGTRLQKGNEFCCHGGVIGVAQTGLRLARSIVAHFPSSVSAQRGQVEIVICPE